MTAFAELCVTSNFSFLRGGSWPQEYVDQAFELGHKAIAITDINTLAGVVQAYARVRSMRQQRIAAAGQRLDFKFVLGSRIVLQDGSAFFLYPTDRLAYGRLCSLLTKGKRRAPKSECHLSFEDLLDHGEGQIVIAVPPEDLDTAFRDRLETLATSFKRNAFLAAAHRYRGDDRARLDALNELGRAARTPIVATNDVLYHAPERRRLQDVISCIREKCTIDEAGVRLEMNAERHLKPADEMARLFHRYPHALENSIEIAERCKFDMGTLRYEYPEEIVTKGLTAQQDLEQRTWAGAKKHYGDDIPPVVFEQLNKELKFIANKQYAPFFLTIDEIVKFARSENILCQGRGSAANSAVCYVLDITAVDPAEGNSLFERFLSDARNEPPDIDVDFEHERREEVIQHIYKKYGRDRAGIAATVIHYRWRRAIREVGKVLSLSEDVTAALSRAVWGWDDTGVSDDIVRGLGLDPHAPRLRLALNLALQLLGFPRHLSQHVGGFVITRGSLSELVPIENASMDDRTVIEWDKDDIEKLGILKVDVLALGMLTCIRKCFDLLRAHYKVDHDLASVPKEERDVYDMICKADTVGVFQIESRAQMSMLPRLKPRTFYDLVIEVAIVRPGPIQGDMVHPYLRRREGKEPVSYHKQELKDVLSKTLGVPLFQEQAMKIAMVAAKFSADEADGLRRSMATFKHDGHVERFRERFITGMVDNDYPQDFAERCFKQIEGFGTYGFPESHAASFAKLVYISAWIKCYYPAAFACGLLNSQPMGFYAPAQLVRDARDHHVEVRPVDISHSAWDNTLEQIDEKTCALRLGFREVKGLSEAEFKAFFESRLPPEEAEALRLKKIEKPHCEDRTWASQTFKDIEPNETLYSFWRRTRLKKASLLKLAEADGFGSLGLSRRQAIWEAQRIKDAPLPLFAAIEHAGSALQPETVEDQITLPLMPESVEVVEDYRSTGLSLKNHPFAFLRGDLDKMKCRSSRDIPNIKNGERTRVAGMVLVRQRPGSASGVIFITLEDEFGIVNVIVWPSLFENYRREILTGKFLAVEGKLQREGLVVHVIAEKLSNITHLASKLDPESQAFAFIHSRADEAERPTADRREEIILRRKELAAAAEQLKIKSRDFH